MRRVASLASGVALLLVAGCGEKEPPAPTPPPGMGTDVMKGTPLSANERAVLANPQAPAKAKEQIRKIHGFPADGSGDR